MQGPTLVIAVFLVGALAGVLLAHRAERILLREAKRKAVARVQDETHGYIARRQQQDVDLQARRQETLAGLREEGRARLAREAERIERREREYESYGSLVEGREKSLAAAQAEVDKERSAIQGLRNEVRQVQERVREDVARLGGWTDGEARAHYLGDLEASVALEEARRQETRLAYLESEVDDRARDLVLRITNRISSDFAEETRPFVVPADSIGRVLAHGPELLRTLGERTGTEMELDRERGNLLIHGEDGVQREVARRTLTRMGRADRPGGRRHRRDRKGGPSRATKEAAAPVAPGGNGWQKEMEAALTAASQAIEADIWRAIQWVVRHLRLRPVHREIQRAMGRLLYRTSHGQNVLGHSYEVGHIGGLLAAELGLEPELGRRCAFLHDIGKAIDVGGEGGHTTLGKEFAARHGEKDPVLNAIEAHHDDVPKTSVYPIVAAVSDAISGARPGARRETSALYAERVDTLEEIARTKPGVIGVYAVHAGRELRVQVDPVAVADEGLEPLAIQIAKEVEERVGGLGCDILLQRETRIVEKAL